MGGNVVVVLGFLLVVVVVVCWLICSKVLFVCLLLFFVEVVGRGEDEVVGVVVLVIGCLGLEEAKFLKFGNKLLLKKRIGNRYNSSVDIVLMIL